MTHWLVAAEASGSSGWAFGWEALVAIGTFGLALGTAWLAYTTRKLSVTTAEEVKHSGELVKESQRQVAASQEQVEASQRHVEVAREAFAALTEPLLSSVPRGTPSRPYSTSDTGDISAEFDTENGGHMSVPFRNVGNAVAVIKSVMFWMDDGSGSTGNAEAVAVPPGEMTQARIELPSNSRFGPEVILAKSNFSLVLSYADAADQPRGATRLDVYHSSSRSLWYVRQVHFGDNDESVRQSPRTSSAPTT
jgi:hypothetical protein